MVKVDIDPMHPSTPHFLRLGLTGWPLEHSLSPRLHEAALRSLGIPGEYRLYPVEPRPNAKASLTDLFSKIRRGELHGLNITIPHKQTVLPLLDRSSPTARLIGAVNTVLWQDGELVGDNTDAAGFLLDLKRVATPEFVAAGGRALLLGAGGAARAVAVALAQAGWQVAVVSRRMEQASRMAADLNPDCPAILSLPLARETFEQPFSLVVNATPLGMTPEVEGSPWPEDISFPPGCVVYDLVYNPRLTRLVGSARAAGLRAESGLGMLVEQAARAFEDWTGLDAPRKAMWAAVSEQETP